MKILGKEWSRFDRISYPVAVVLGLALPLFADMRFPGIE